LRANSAVLLKYQIAAPVPMTAARMRRVSKRPKQDFIGRRKRGVFSFRSYPQGQVSSVCLPEQRRVSAVRAIALGEGLPGVLQRQVRMIG